MERAAGRAPPVGALFDVGYCLMDESVRLSRALAWVSAALGASGRSITPARLDQAYREACRRPAPGEPSLLVRLLGDLGLEPREARAIRQALPWDVEPLTLYPDTLVSLRTLRQAGFLVGVLANQPASAQVDLDRAGVTALCNGVWLSGAVGLAKPAPAFFALALDAWGLPPGRVAYVGDRPDNDVAPAKALGMATLRVRTGPHAEQTPRGEGERPGMEAASLTEAVRHLLAWQAALVARSLTKPPE